MASSPLICWQFKWNVLYGLAQQYAEFLMSDFIRVPDVAEKAFRLGIFFTNRDIIRRFCCYVNNLELGRLGFSPRGVTVTRGQNQLLRSYSSSKDELWDLQPVDVCHTSVLFQQSIEILANGPYFFNFRIYVGGALEQHYEPHRFDGNISQQLWEAVVNKQHNTDVVFKVGNSAFPAHKFILAARSSVFRTLFDAEPQHNGQFEIVDFPPEILEQFLRFLYTGQLVNPTSKQLGMIADRYNVKTLTSLCRTVAANEVSLKNELLDWTTSKNRTVNQKKIW